MCESSPLEQPLQPKPLSHFAISQEWPLLTFYLSPGLDSGTSGALVGEGRTGEGGANPRARQDGLRGAGHLRGIACVGPQHPSAHHACTP